MYLDETMKWNVLRASHGLRLIKVIPVTAMVLRPHFNDMEYKLRPGMITLTWTSMNIDTYKGQVGPRREGTIESRSTAAVVVLFECKAFHISGRQIIYRPSTDHL